MMIQTDDSDDSESGESHSATLQRVCLFHLDDPPIYGQIDWVDYVQMMFDAANLLQVEEDHLLGLFDIEVTLPDFPPDVVPLIAYLFDDFPPGAQVGLSLTDLEIHANACEANYHTTPTIERSVIAMPTFADRRGVFQTADVDLYCAHERDRCLLHHNLMPIVTEGNPRMHIRHGAYLKITIPPPEDIDLPTHQVLQHSREPPDSDLFRISPSPSGSTRSGYSPSLVPSEEIRRQFGSHDENMLLQTSKIWHDGSVPLDTVPDHQVDRGLDGRQCSFTDEFLRTVRLWNQSVEDLPEFEGDQDDISTYAPWIQDLYALWQNVAQIGPGNVERLGRVETWFTDHFNFQHCVNSRVAILGPDFDNWEHDLRVTWRDRLIQDAPLEFYLVSPLPEDAASQIVGQVMLVQRAVPFQRSVVISVYDNAYAQGQPFSQGLVTTDRIDLFSVTHMLQASEDCPPEQPQNACTLWFGNRQFLPEERVYARHGHAFRFLIHRRDPATMMEMTDLVDYHLGARLAHMRSGAPLEFPLAHMFQCPAWVQELQRNFDNLASTEREDEGPVAYVQTWHLNGERAPRCQNPRTVRLRTGDMAWMDTLLHAWRDRINPLLRTDVFWIDPQPRNTPGQSFIGHLILAQEIRPEWSAILLSAIVQDETQPDIQHVAVFVHESLSYGTVSREFPIPERLWECPLTISRGSQFLHDDHFLLVEHGDNIVIDIILPLSEHDDATDATGDDVALLQIPAQHSHRQHAPTKIELAQAIPLPIWTTIDCQRLDFLRRQLLYIGAIVPCFDLACLIGLKKAHPEWHNLVPWTREIPLRFEFYTDGSFKRSVSQATAGIVLIVQTSDGPRFGGLQSAWCWQLASAPRSEASAVLIALQWAITLTTRPEFHFVPLHFHFDNMYAGNAAQGRCSSVTNEDLTLVARSLTTWLEQLHGAAVEWAHVKGHSDHPWNDLADAVATHALATSRVTFDIGHLMSMCTFEAQDTVTIQWLWLYERSIPGHPDAPPLCGLTWRLNCAAPLAQVPQVQAHPFELRRLQRQVDKAADEPLMLRCATANVLTMYPDQRHSSSYFGARAEHLARQFREAGVHCVGIQESRSQRHGHDFFEFFHVISSAASSKGHGGMQLWFAQNLKTAQGTVQLSHEHFRILHGDERRLIVCLQHPALKILFLVLHAPCTDDLDEVNEWWQTTSRTIPSSFSSWTWIVLCDSNSRIGSVHSNSIGAHGGTTENARGSLFHDWLIDHGLWLPQTFEATHEGTHHTWTHPNQTRARLDFIGVSTNIPSDAVKTWVDTNIDLSLHRPDHDCVCADIVLHFAPKCSHQKLSIASQADMSPLWYHDVHTHAALLQQSIAKRMPHKPRDHLRKTHLSDETLALIATKKQKFKHLKGLRKQWRHHFLHSIFSAWRGSLIIDPHDSVSLPKLCTNIAIAEEDYRLASLGVCSAVRRDDCTFYCDIAEETGHLAAKGFHRIWDAIRPVLPKWKNRRKHNLRCAGPTPEQQVQHYCDLEGGRATNYDQLLHDCNASQCARAEDLPLQIHLSQLPSRLDIENRLQQLATNRAPGIDRITPSFLRELGPAIAGQVAQLAFKMWVLGQEPLQFKGGHLHSISKKVHSNNVAHMRGILLVDVLGKIMHALLRQRFLPTVLKWRHPMQLGGFPNCSTLFATQYLRAFQLRAQSLHLSSAVLFIDVKSAFHSMVRQVLFGEDLELDPHLHDLLRQADVDVAALQEEMRRTSAVFHDEVPAGERRLLKDAHQYTWFSIAGMNDAYHTTRGSRPGSPLADIAFNAMMVHVLDALHDLLLQIPALARGLHHLSMPAPPVTWVDDVAIPIVSETASELEGAISNVAENAVAAFKKFGLTLNFQKKKTEAVVAFRSDGAPQHRQALFVDRLGRIALPSLGTTLQCVATYEHLGTIFMANGGMQAEVTHRCARAAQAYRQVAKPILRNRHVPIAVRLKLFESLVIPVLMHGSGNWELLTAKQFQSLHSHIMKWQRTIINNGCWTDDQRSDFALQCQWQLAPLALRLAKARLLHAFHCVRDGPGILIDYITAVAEGGKSWILALRHAIRWLSSMSSTFCPASLIDADTEHVIAWLHRNALHGPAVVRRMYKRSIMQQHVLGDAIALHDQLFHTFISGGVQFDSTSQCLPSVIDKDYPCTWCSQRFDSHQKLQVHMWLAHHLISEERRFVFSDTCLACHKCFWSAARLQQHLRYSRRHANGCYAQMTWRYAPLDEACAVVIPEDLRGYQRLPSVPVASTSSSPDDANLATAADARRVLQETWTSGGFPTTLAEDVHIDVSRKADHLVSNWFPVSHVDPDEVVFAIAEYIGEDDCRLWALCLWIQSSMIFSRFSHLEPATFQRLRTALNDLMHSTQMGRLLAWSHRMDCAHVPVAADDTPSGLARKLFDVEPFVDPFGLQQTCFDKFLRPVMSIPDCGKVPVCVENGQHVLWILHLFSGRRRKGDCHFWVQCFHNMIPGYELRILSVDTAIHPQLGNLDRGPVFDRIVRIIRKKFFAAGLTGPPCETFSAARHLALSTGCNPRPLRSSAMPWLLPERSGRELYQTMIGSRLLFHSLILETELILAGAGSIMEHPREHDDAERASVWRTPCHQRLIMSLPDAVEHHVEQWRYGSSGIKPTTLRALNLGPSTIVAGVLADMADPLAVRPANPLKGRNKDGTFKTSAAKEYPSQLCRALVLAVVAGVRSRLTTFGTDACTELSSDEQRWIEELYNVASIHHSSGTFLPDFQG